jgi:hypothetical protein
MEHSILNIRVVDKAGNEEDVKSNVINIDKSSPVTTASPVKADWYNTDVDLTIESSDNLSGVSEIQYKVNDGDWLTYSNGITISNEGIHKILYRSIDNAGNIEDEKSVEVRIDKTAPTLNVSFDQAVITNRNHQLIPIKAVIVAEDTLSGAASFQLISIVSNQLDNGKGDGNTTQDIREAELGTPDLDFLVRAERSGSGDRVYKVTYKATDKAGNSIISSQNIVVKHDNFKK